MSGLGPNLDHELLEAERALNEYAASTEGTPPPGFSDWVMRSLAGERLPRRGLLASLAALLTTPGPRRLATQAVALSLVVVVGVASAVALGQVGNLLPDNNVGTSPPVPSVESTPSLGPTPTAEPTPSPTTTPVVEPPPSGAAEPIPVPTPEESEDESQTPSPSETPSTSETPEP